MKFLQNNLYQDEDEEALIDKLASLAAAVGPEAFLSKPPQHQASYPNNPVNYDLASYLTAAAASSGANSPSVSLQDGQWGMPENSLDSREALLKLPREFGYKPTDIRFYLNADQFPASADILQPQQQQPVLNQEIPALPQISRNALPQQQVVPPDNNIPPQRHHVEGQQEQILGEDKSDFYFMKKKEQAGWVPPDRNYVPAPSHIMASEHSASSPGYSSRQSVVEKPFSYSDMYYIGTLSKILNGFLVKLRLGFN